jgi:hypothetical protein
MMKSYVVVLVVAPALSFIPAPLKADDDRVLAGVRRIFFLGDSIPYSGQYVEYSDGYLRTNRPSLRCEFLNLGLPSETVSGLSEPRYTETRSQPSLMNGLRN